MFYLAKLAHRLSRIKALVPLLLVASACSSGEKGDFLGPGGAIIRPPVVSIRISPQVATVKANEVFQFNAIGITPEGREVPADVDWYTTTGGWVSSNGQFTAPNNGQYRVLAVVRGKASVRDSAVAGVWERATDVVLLSVDPDSVELYEDEGIDLDAYIKQADGTVRKTDAVIWASSGGSIDASGWFRASTSADYTVTAVASNGVSATSKIKVRRKRAVSVVPSRASLGPGDTIQFVASGPNGSAPAVTWTATGGTITTTGRYVADSTAGTFRVVAAETGGPAVDTSTVTIASTAAPTLVSIAISPATLSLQTGGTRQFTATGTWSDNSTGTVAVTWTATGGTITSSGLYTAGTTAGTFRVIGTQIGGGKADTTAVTITAPPILTAVVISPSSATLATGWAMQFTAVGKYSNGGSAAIPITWSATGGTVNASGLYTAGTTAGSFRVIAQDQGSTLSDTAAVTILAAPPPGQYSTIAKKDWNAYADKSGLAGQIGVEGQLNTVPPVLPVTDFYDLVPDPLFGKVVRYNGGPHLNIADPTQPGRVATHQIAIGTLAGKPNATWWTAPDGKSWYPTHVWVRQFLRFSPNWTGLSQSGGQGSADYKTMFLRYYNSSARHEFKVTAIREWILSGGDPGLTQVSQGTLPWNTVLSINVQYGVSGYYGVDLYKMVKPTALDGKCYPSVVPCAPAGDSEWYEIVMHHKTIGERGEFTQYVRRYTLGGAPNPGTWMINAHYFVGKAGEVFPGVSHYQMGVNRNRQYDWVMYHYWGPYEVVDGSVYPNPWGLPGA